MRSMNYSEFRDGLTISFSEEMVFRPQVMSTDVVIVTWELPLRLFSKAEIIQVLQTGFLTPQILIV